MNNRQTKKTNNMSVVKIEKLSKTYYMGDAELHALFEVDLEINAGDYLAIMGPSGSGKSPMPKANALQDTEE